MRRMSDGRKFQAAGPATRNTRSPNSCSSGRTGAVPAGLWKRRAGRPSGSPDASTPVGSECSGPTDLPPENPRPHNSCSHQSALTAGSSTNTVQAGCAGVQSSTWRRITLPWSADPRRRLARTTTTPFYQHQPPRGTASQTVNSRQPSFCGCGSRHLERFFALPM